MKHHEPGRPYPHASARQKARRRQIIRNRIIFGVGVVAVLALIIWGISALFGGRSDASSVPASSAVSSGSTAESAAVSQSTAAESQPAATPVPTIAPTPVPTVPPTPEPPAFTAAWDTTGEEGFPYLVAVNRETQTVTVYSKDEAGNYTVPDRAMICSTGRDTPVGHFHTTDQYTWRALVGGVYGQYATRITGSILFHSVPYFAQDKSQLESEEFNKLGTPASLGCVRLQIKDCKWIYDECPSGTPVVLFDGDSSMDPLGNPGFEPLDLSSPNAGWDPSDPDPANPWNA